MELKKMYTVIMILFSFSFAYARTKELTSSNVMEECYSSDDLIDADESIAMKWDITYFDVGDVINDASYCIYVSDKVNAPDSNMRAWRINNQTWVESLSTTDYDNMDLENQTDSLSWNGTASGSYICFNATDFLQEEIDRGNDNFTVRVEDDDYLHDGGSHSITEDNYLWFGRSTANAFKFESTSDTGGSGNLPLIDVTFTRSNTAPTLEQLEEPADPSTYSFGGSYEFNITACDEEGIDDISSIIFEWDGVNSSNVTTYTDLNSSCGEWNFTKLDLSVQSGTTYKWYVNDTLDEVTSSSDSFTVSKATPSVIVKLDGSSITPQTRNYPNQTDLSTTESNDGDGDCSYSLDKNGSSVSDGLQDLGVGGYNFTYSVSGCTNFTNAQDEVLLTMNPDSPTLSLTLDGSSTSPSTRTYDSSNSTDVQSSESNSNDGGCSYTLEKNSSGFSNGQHYFGVDGYNFTYYTDGCTNYTSGSVERLLTVNKGSLTMTLTLDGDSSASQTRTFDPSNSTDAQGNDTDSGDGDCTYGLKMNGTSIGNGNYLLGGGGHNFTFYGESCSNYTSGQVERILGMNKAKPLLIIYNGTDFLNTSDLVGYWRFENDTKDYSGYGNDGTLNGYNFYDGELQGNPTLSTGYYGYGYSVDDAVMQRINISDTQPINMSQVMNASWGFWVKVGEMPTSNKQFFDPGTDRWDFNIEGNTGKFFIWFTNRSNVGCQVSTYMGGDNMVDDQWHYVFSTKNSTGVYAYLDGNYKGSASCSVDGSLTHSTISSYDFQIPSHSFNISFDEVRMWNDSLTPDEVVLEMNSRHPVHKDDLIVSWSFESNNDTYAMDTNHIFESRIGGGVYFNETDKYIDYGTGLASKMNGTNKFTLVGWIKNNEFISDGYSTVIRNQKYDGKWGFGLHLYNQSGPSYAGLIHCSFGNGTDWAGDFKNASYLGANNTDWNHIVCTFNGTHVFQYHNGNLINIQAENVGEVRFDATPLTTGKSTTWNRYTNGTVDEVMIWNRTLTADEILMLYESTNPTYETTTNYTLTTDSPQPSYNISRNYTESSADNDTDVRLGSGYYWYEFFTLGNENYTNRYLTLPLKVDKKTPGLGISGITNGTYQLTETVYWTSNDVDSLTIDSERNSTDISLENNTAVTLSAGIWNYTIYTSGNENYSSTSLQSWNLINNGTANITITGVTNTTYPVTQTIYWGSDDDDGLSISGEYNQTSFTNNTDPDLGGGLWNITAYISGNENYTSSSSIVWNNIDKAKPILILSNGSSSVNTSDLVGYWRFENDTNDYSGYGNDGTVSGYDFNDGSFENGAVIGGGYFGYGLDFGDDGDDYINVGDVPSLNFSNTSTYTISFWHNMSDLYKTNANPFISKTDYGGIPGGEGYYFDIDSGADGIPDKLRCGGYTELSDNKAQHTIQSDYKNNWRYYTCLFNSTHYVIYVNGTEKAVTSATDGPEQYGHSFRIGGYSAGGKSNGTTDEIRIWNKSLSQSEIEAEMNSRRPVRYDDLIASWSFENNNDTHTMDTNHIVESRIGGGNYFNGSGNYIDIPNVNVSDTLTYSFWFKKYDSGTDNLFSNMRTLIRVSSTSVTWWPDVSLPSNTTTTNHEVDKWHHLVITQSGTNFEVYFNGSLLENGGTHQVNTATDSSSIGEYGGTKNLNASVDEVMIFNRTLTADEVSLLYESQVGYITSTTFNGSEQNTGDSDVTYTLFRNETDKTTAENGTATTMPGGYHYYLFNTSGGNNYTQSSILVPLQVVKGGILTSLYLNSSEADFYYVNDTPMNFTASLNVSTLTANLDTNITGWSTQTGTGSVENISTWSSSSNTIYNVTGYFDGDENYTASSQTYYSYQDVTLPTISGFQVNDTYITINESVMVEVETSDSFGLSLVWAELNTSHDRKNVSMTLLGNGNYSYNLTKSDLGGLQNNATTIHILYIYSNDTSDNIQANSTSLTFTYANATHTHSKDKSETFNSASDFINFTAYYNDTEGNPISSSCQVSIGSNEKKMTYSDGIHMYRWSVYGYSVDTYVYTIQCNNTGYETESSNGTFSVKTGSHGPSGGGGGPTKVEFLIKRGDTSILIDPLIDIIIARPGKSRNRTFKICAVNDSLNLGVEILGGHDGIGWINLPIRDGETFFVNDSMCKYFEIEIQISEKAETGSGEIGLRFYDTEKGVEEIVKINIQVTDIIDVLINKMKWGIKIRSDCNCGKWIIKDKLGYGSDICIVGAKSLRIPFVGMGMVLLSVFLSNLGYDKMKKKVKGKLRKFMNERTWPKYIFMILIACLVVMVIPS